MVSAVALRNGVTPAQVALAWVNGRLAALGVPVVPIPGTERWKWLEQRVAALEVTLDEQDLAQLDQLNEQVVGARYERNRGSGFTADGGESLGRCKSGS